MFENCHKHLSATALILNLAVADCASVFRCLVQHCLSGWSNKCQSQLQPRTGLDLQSNMKSSAGTQTSEVEVRHPAQCLMCLWCVCCGVCLQTSHSCFNIYKSKTRCRHVSDCACARRGGGGLRSVSTASFQLPTLLSQKKTTQHFSSLTLNNQPHLILVVLSQTF